MKEAGSTVEASLVVPIIIWIVFLVVCHVLIQGDRMSVLLTADRVLEELCDVADYDMSQTEIEKDVVDKITEMLLFHKLNDVEIKCYGDEFSIDIIMECMVDVAFIKDKRSHISRKIQKQKICRTIRRRDIAADMFK